MNTSAEARVVAAFTFIVVLMLGAWSALEQLFAASIDFLVAEPEPARFVVAVLPFIATVIAYRSVNATEVAWAQALGSAAVILGALSSLGGVLYFVASW